MEIPILDRILSSPFSAAARYVHPPPMGSAGASSRLPASSAVRPRRRSLDGGQCNPRMYRLGAVADQAGEVMDVEGVTGFGDEPDPRAEAGANQFLPHRPDREQHRDRRAGWARRRDHSRPGYGPLAGRPVLRRGGAR